MEKYSPSCMEPLSNGICKNGCASVISDDAHVLKLAGIPVDRSELPATEQATTEQPAASRKYPVLMSDTFPPRVWEPDEQGAFGSYHFRSDIGAITFLDTLDECPSDAWDVSQARDGSVMAWVKPNGIDGYGYSLCDLYIGAEGGVAAPADCSYLFAGYTCVRSIRFNGIFDTANVTNMRYMFWCCGSLEALDLSSFDIAKVTDMESMFLACEKLTALHVKNWNTSDTNTEGMFYRCPLGKDVVSAILSGKTVST